MENLSGPRESILHLSRASQLPYNAKSKKWLKNTIILLIYWFPPISPSKGSPIELSTRRPQYSKSEWAKTPCNPCTGPCPLPKTARSSTAQSCLGITLRSVPMNYLLRKPGRHWAPSWDLPSQGSGNMSHSREYGWQSSSAALKLACPVFCMLKGLLTIEFHLLSPCNT